MGRFANQTGFVTDRAIAGALGMESNTYSNRKKRGAIPYKEILEYLNKHNMCLDLVFKESQDMNVQEDSGNYKTDEYTSIPHYDIQVAAGHGAINGQEAQLKPLAFRRDWLAARHLSATELVVVDVKGDSMEPYLTDHDLVLVDRSQIEITSGKTYVLRLDGHLLVKNLQLLPGGLVQVASFNTGFPPYSVDLSNDSLDMSVIGRVVASMHEW